jgi:hypothetical protein
MNTPWNTESLRDYGTLDAQRSVMYGQGKYEHAALVGVDLEQLAITHGDALRLSRAHRDQAFAWQRLGDLPLALSHVDTAITLTTPLEDFVTYQVAGDPEQHDVARERAAHYMCGLRICQSVIEEPNGVDEEVRETVNERYGIYGDKVVEFAFADRGGMPDQYQINSYSDAIRYQKTVGKPYIASTARALIATTKSNSCYVDNSPKLGLFNPKRLT